LQSYVLTIGKFEGIHLGHQALLAQVVNMAKSLGLASAAMVFEPHPYIFFGNTSYKPLFTNNERNHLLLATGLEHIISTQFDESFATLSPRDFSKKIFAEHNAKLVIVGENYRFGKNRAGDIDFLRKEADTHKAQVQTVLPVSFCRCEPISTSTIRKLLSQNNLSEANRQLGFPFFIIGTVTRGKQLGRTLNFPTINIYPTEEKFLPMDGVYATQTIINGEKYNGVTNIGLRPTVDNSGSVRSVETHLFNYTKDLYDQHVKTELLEFIRPEQRFNSLDELKAQIALDALSAQKFFM